MLRRFVRAYIAPRESLFDIADDVVTDAEFTRDCGRGWIRQEHSLYQRRRLPIDLRFQAASDIFGGADWLKVIRVHAVRVATQVVQHHLVRNRALDLLVHVPMRADGAAIFGDVDVAEAVAGRIPVPTSGVRIDGIRANTLAVSVQVSERFALYPSPSRVGDGCECGRLPAATLANTGRVWFRNDRATPPTGGMAQHIANGLSLDAATGGIVLPCEFGLLTTTTHAVTGWVRAFWGRLMVHFWSLLNRFRGATPRAATNSAGASLSLNYTGFTGRMAA